MICPVLTLNLPIILAIEWYFIQCYLNNNITLAVSVISNNNIYKWNRVWAVLNIWYCQILSPVSFSLLLWWAVRVGEFLGVTWLNIDGITWMCCIFGLNFIRTCFKIVLYIVDSLSNHNMERFPKTVLSCPTVVSRQTF